MISLRDREHIFEKLRSGVVPERGLEAFAVGIDRQRKEMARVLEFVKSGEGSVKFLRGGYGCGKTFNARLAVLDAQKQGFATSFVVVSDNDLHFYKFDDVYRKVVQELSTPTCPRGALGDIIDRWIVKVENALIALGADEDSPDFDAKVGAKIADDIVAMTGGKAPEDMGRVLKAIFECKQAGKLREANSLISWLAGSTNVAASEKKLAGIKGEISSTDAMAYLHGILELVKRADYAGLLIVIDEAETILRMRNDVRGKSLNAIRQIADATDRYKKLLWLFTGTPDFFDSPKGVKGLKPLHDRIEFQAQGAPRQPQIELKPFDAARLRDVALGLRELFPGGDPSIVAQRVQPADIDKLVAEVTTGFRGDVGVVPRQFLRRLVNWFDSIADGDGDGAPGADAPALEATFQEARAAQGQKPYDFIDDGDPGSYAVENLVEF